MSLPSFPSYFHALHGHDPFPWQTRAAEQLAKRATMAVTVPTGMGKSALVDAAVWAAAHGAWRRIAFVVDRRIVVDAVYERALHIQACLAGATDRSMRELAQRVGELQVVRLRGGVFGDDDWVLYPERLSIVLTTVDQLGSRLLFRGYGVSPKRWSMHAGFFGADSLVVVDEAHLSNPFLQTLEALRKYGAGVALVPMTATPPATWSASVIGLESDDLAVPTVARRLHAAKLASLIDVGGSDDEVAREARNQVQRLLGDPDARRVLVVVNRVATARRCFEQMQAQGVAATLLTGRGRAVDRDAELARVIPLLAAGRKRHVDDAPFAVIATQTVEVGADFDFDALVTESAPLSALRQRFGRLDRLGERGTSSAVILHRANKADKDDPVYGPALAQAIQWLRERVDQGQGVIDFGIAAFAEALRQSPAPVEPQIQAATLLPAHVGLFAQTGDFAPEFDVSAWLHGASQRVPDVMLVWRDDLDGIQPEHWPAAVALLPPMLREGLALSPAVARRWLVRAKIGDTLSDVGSDHDDDDLPSGEPERPVLLWRGANDCRVIPASHVRPGDTVVLPASAGGCDAWGWAPASTEPVSDLADLCLVERLNYGATRRVALRLVPAHAHGFGVLAREVERCVASLTALNLEAITASVDLDDDIAAAQQALLDLVFHSEHPLAKKLIDARLEPHPDGFVLVGRGIDDDEDTVETGRAVPLDVHHADVGRWSERLAAGDPLAQQIIAAAFIHDAGKQERRMQHLLHGDKVSAALGPVMAKSGLRRRDQRLAALVASGLPRGFRHEFASLAYADIPDLATRYLVATHHGRGRPWLAPCEDPLAPGASYAGLDAHWPAVWARCLEEMGPWAMARAEHLLRAADARASIEEAAGGSTTEGRRHD